MVDEQGSLSLMDKAVGPAETHGSIDQRRFDRIDVKVEVTLESESNFYNGFTENISAGGLFVATYDVRPLGSFLSMEFTVPGWKEPVSIKGEVRWVREYNSMTPDVTPGMGLSFIDLSPEAQSIVESFTRHKDPIFYDE